MDSEKLVYNVIHQGNVLKQSFETTLSFNYTVYSFTAFCFIEIQKLLGNSFQKQNSYVESEIIAPDFLISDTMWRAFSKWSDIFMVLESLSSVDYCFINLFLSLHWHLK